MASHEPHTLRHSAGIGLAVLSVINLLSYLDRYVLSALVESLKHSELALSDLQLGSLMSGFLIVYTVAAPVFGVLGDRRSRPRLIAFGVACWSVATVLSGFAISYPTLLAARASVGIGEAAYVTIAPSLLSDYYPARQRARVMGIFFCAIPVGSALGYIVGGFMNAHFGWRDAFFVAGAPGLALAAVCLFLKDPPRGAQDRADDAGGAGAADTSDGGARGASGATLGQTANALTHTVISLLRNRAYARLIAGYASYTFAVGGLGYWMPAFLERVRHVPNKDATIDFGAVVVATGLIGTFVGGWLGDYLIKYSRQAYLWLSAAVTLIAAPCVWLALTCESHAAYLGWMIAAQLCLFISTGPINAAIVNLVAPGERATAIAFAVFAIHLLGDVPSPYIIGWLSSASSLQQAVKIVPVAVLLAAAVWVLAARTQASAAPAPASAGR